MTLLLSVAVLFLVVSQVAASPKFHQIPQCKIFCSGPVLHAIQTAGIFQDSKHFVDMPLRFSPDETLTNFEKLENKTDPKTLRAFVSEHFLEPGTELQSCHPSDYVVEPGQFNKIQDPVYRQWAYDIHKKWRTLCRRVKPGVMMSPEKYSLIPVPFPFIAPGGRFRELYYWDTYWIIKGLLASEMFTTAKNMIRNLGYMVDKYGFVPNGGRIYYVHRTQPPLLPACVQAYFQATQDKAFLSEMLPLLEKEHEFWHKERTVAFSPEESTDIHQLFQYRVDAHTPRPESYKEDIETAHHQPKESEKKKVWSDVAAACESGWDFSSRWFSREGKFRGELKGVKTSKIIPVDLNAFLCGNSKMLGDFHEVLGNTSTQEYYRQQHSTMKDSLYRSFWDQTLGTWSDIDLDLGAPNKHYYVSNPTPLFTGCAHNDKEVGRKVYNYLQQSGATTYSGGLPTSFEWTGEQWDSPNGWAPTNHIVIEGLRMEAEAKADHALAEAAFRLADRWIQTNYFVYARSGGKMFEKYNVEMEFSSAGGGGEYEVQEGFGWTNGVILDLLLTYGDRLRAPASHSFFFAKQLKEKAAQKV